jgi:TetR/AcrR family transcriptional regulator, transcriptional repressor for nem operon
MSSRIQCPSETKLQIVLAAGDLFHKGGVRCTTTDEIIEAAGVAKAEFLQYFGCKRDLVDSVLRFHFERMAAGTGPGSFEIDSWSDLEECLASQVEFQKKFRMTRSCPMGVLGSEMREEDEAIQHFLTRVLDLWITRLEHFFSREKAAERLASNVDVERLSNFCVTVIQGAMLTGKIRLDVRCVESIFEDLLNHLKRYVRVPTAPKKRLSRDRRAKQLSAMPKPPVPTTVVELSDSQSAGDPSEDHSIEQCWLEDKV